MKFDLVKQKQKPLLDRGIISLLRKEGINVDVGLYGNGSNACASERLVCILVTSGGFVRETRMCFAMPGRGFRLPST